MSVTRGIPRDVRWKTHVPNLTEIGGLTKVNCMNEGIRQTVDSPVSRSNSRWFPSSISLLFRPTAVRPNMLSAKSTRTVDEIPHGITVSVAILLSDKTTDVHPVDTVPVPCPCVVGGVMSCGQ